MNDDQGRQSPHRWWPDKIEPAHSAPKNFCAETILTANSSLGQSALSKQGKLVSPNLSRLIMTLQTHSGRTIKAHCTQDRSVLSPDAHERRKEGKKERRKEGKYSLSKEII
ncbi:hypothetical protein [Gluconobacter roseus]|uniref:hypothetical protein n=1 Tax=Gluconobacter roseus TaxID=586239 RepID=UPI0018CC1981|nr:hypothetical protein [Gluconobacter roseus]